MSLSLNSAGLELSGDRIESNLPGSKDEVADANRLRVRTDGSRCSAVWIAVLTGSYRKLYLCATETPSGSGCGNMALLLFLPTYDPKPSKQSKVEDMKRLLCDDVERVAELPGFLLLSASAGWAQSAAQPGTTRPDKRNSRIDWNAPLPSAAELKTACSEELEAVGSGAGTLRVQDNPRRGQHR